MWSSSVTGSFLDFLGGTVYGFAAVAIASLEVITALGVLPALKKLF